MSERGKSDEELPDVSINANVRTINTSRIVAYANAYAINPNPKFGNYISGNVDCQNFASQCLWYALGGADTQAAINNHYEPMAAGGSQATNWYHGSTAYSGDPANHWIADESFDDLISRSSSLTYGLQGTVTSGYGNAKVGDIIQVDWNGDMWFDHSFVVVGLTGSANNTGNIRVAAHTSACNNVQLSQFSVQNYRTIHINQFSGYQSGGIMSLEEDE